MSDVAPYILRASQSVFAGYGTLYIVAAICWPGWFLDTLAINHVRGRFDRKYRREHPNHISIHKRPWHELPLALITLIAVGVLAYSAAYAIVSIIPFSWGSENEDGEWEGARYMIQAMIAFSAPVALVGRLERNAEILVWGPAERKARVALTDAIRFARHLAPEASNNIARSVKQALEPSEEKENGIAQRYAADLSRWIKRDIAGELHSLPEDLGV
ncbi:MAG: hypothetical protein B7X90_02830 [Novosphingobium sp. 17-62-19]|uniref:hypothetical protein n=1 Tax=Novosphingobium sp. 17-62-19 TaxID=1970406 RepID=UPI000BCD85A0|nr:hypothetical protein [Novosphingobium sp. 17-62-19]OZA21186.1 MAG: hypothetical protein B7X90_02830 [Novosphingobium sp. 17-62-19]HQS96362.1 hypothetical protein [Novosphingobium sp.]